MAGEAERAVREQWVPSQHSFNTGKDERFKGHLMEFLSRQELGHIQMRRTGPSRREGVAGRRQSHVTSCNTFCLVLRLPEHRSSEARTRQLFSLGL